MFRTGFVKQGVSENDVKANNQEDPPKTKCLEAVALEKKKQSRFTKKVQNLKKSIKTDEDQLNKTTTLNKKKKHATRAVIYVGHIPHGFYEHQMRKYFSQFGKVTNVMVCRSRNTGKSRGFGFVEFAYPEVAKIAAETMDNYLMFKRRVVAKYIPPEKCRRNLFSSKISESNPPKTKNRRKTNTFKNKNIPTEKYIENSKEKLKQINKNLKKLKSMGIDYDFQPVYIPKTIKCRLQKSQEITDKKETTTKVNTLLKDKAIDIKKQKIGTVNKSGKIVKNKSSTKFELIKLAANEMLKDKNHVITTRSKIKRMKSKQ